MYYLSDICSMCLQRVQNLKSISYKDVDGTVVEEKVKIFLLELIHFRPNVPKYICNNCLDHLNYIYKFRLKCLKNISILNEYVKELEASGPKKSLLVSLLSDTNDKEDQLKLVNQKENKVHNNSPQDNISVETVFIKDEIEETNNALHDTANIIEESNKTSSQDDIKSEVTETQQNSAEDIVKQENESVLNNSQVAYEVFSEFNDEKQIDDSEDSNSSNISESNDCQNISKEIPQNKQYECTVCQKTYASSSSLKKHSHVHKKDRPFDLTKTLKLPRRRKASTKREKKRTECSECHKVFKNAYRLQCHARIHSNERPFKCTTCEKSFKQRSVLLEHMSIHTGKNSHICDICGLSFTHLARHINTVHHKIRNYKCKECGKGFIKTSDLNNHMRIHTGERPFQCSICDRTFTFANTLKIHSRTHREKSGDGSETALEMEKKHVCVVCQKRFFTLAHLKRHMISHSDERPHTCTICNKTFKRPSALKEHIVTHTGERPFMCNICGLKCFTKGHLFRHIRVVHNNIREFKCEDCNKAFAKANDLERHSRIHKGIRPFKCTICDKAFTMENTLKLHGRTHLRKPDDSKPAKEKKYECGVCQKKFSTTRLLRRHGLTHTIEGTPHKCQSCDKSFKYQNNLRKHELAKHSDRTDV